MVPYLSLISNRINFIFFSDMHASLTETKQKKSTITFQVVLIFSHYYTIHVDVHTQSYF